MVCSKCGYNDKKEVVVFNEHLCSICSVFCPDEEQKFKDYINEKIDWKELDSFRKKGFMPGLKKRIGMERKVCKGKVVNRAPYGYDCRDGVLFLNKDASEVHNLFKTFLNKDLSLNQLSKKYGLSVNGIKKVLKNRTYLGELRFNGLIYKADHKKIISPEIFYAVNRKLEGYLRPREKKTEEKKGNKTKDSKKDKDNVRDGGEEPLKAQKEDLELEINENGSDEVLYSPIFSEE